MTLADHAVRLNLASGRTDLPPAILMTDFTRMPDPSTAARSLPDGAAILVRHPEPVRRRSLALTVAPLCRAKDLLLIVSNDLELACEAGAAGLHLPERTATSAEAFQVCREWRGLLTVAAHSPRALLRARVLGADAALVSPVFRTFSHPEREPIGLFRFLAWSRAVRFPVYAMGGLTAANAGRLHGRNLVGIAGIGGFG